MANFPNSFDDDTTLYIAVNNQRTQLTAGIDDTTLTIPVVSTAGFPDTGFITILTGDDITVAEAIEYTSITSTQFNASQRGAGGTTAVAHANADNVDLTVVAAHHNELKDAVISLEHFVGISGSENFVPLDEAGDALITGTYQGNTVVVNDVTASGTLTTISGRFTVISGTEPGLKVADDLIVAGHTAFSGTATFNQAQTWAVTPVITGDLSDFDLELDDTHHVVVVSGSNPHSVSLDFDGSGSEYLDSNAGTIGIAGSWSIGVWCKRFDTTNGTNVIFAIETGTANRILVLQGDGVSDPDFARAAIRDSTGSGASERIVSRNNALTLNAWRHIVVTFDGTTLSLYSNASGPSTTGASITMTDTSRQIRVGAAVSSPASQNFEGRVYQAQIWDSVLTGSEVTALYNNGNPSRLDLTQNFGNYTSASNLQHWYRLGNDLGDIGKDEGLGTLRDLVNLTAITADDDVVNDAPGSIGNLNIILPDAPDNKGRTYVIKDCATASDDNITVTGTSLIEGNNHFNLVTNNDFVEFISDGVQWKIISTSSGTLSGGSALVTLQEAYDNDSGIITTISGKPVHIIGNTGDSSPEFKVTGSGHITEGLTIGDASTHLSNSSITTGSGIFTDSITVSGLPVSTAAIDDINNISSGSITLNGLGSNTVFTVGNTISVSGSAGTSDLDDINGISTGSITITGGDNITTTTIGNVITISGSAGGEGGGGDIDDINGISSGSITINSVGSIDVRTSGQTITVSGGSSSDTYFVPDAPPVSGTSFDDEFDDLDFNTDKWSLWDVDGSLLSSHEEEFGIRLRIGPSSTGWVGYFQDAPSSGAYMFITKVGVTGAENQSDMKAGIFIAGDLSSSPSTADLLSATLHWGSTFASGFSIRAEEWGSYNSPGGASATVTDNLPRTGVYVRIRYDGGTRVDVDFSYDGLGWQTILRENTITFTPSKIGFGAVNTGTNTNVFNFQFFRVDHRFIADRTQPLLGRRVSVISPKIL